jgi:hypothetical protein
MAFSGKVVLICGGGNGDVTGKVIEINGGQVIA